MLRAPQRPVVAMATVPAFLFSVIFFFYGDVRGARVSVCGAGCTGLPTCGGGVGETRGVMVSTSAVILFVCCLLNRLVYLRDGSAQTMLRAATLR